MLALVAGNQSLARPVENDELKDGPTGVENALERKISHHFYGLSENGKGLMFCQSTGSRVLMDSK